MFTRAKNFNSEYAGVIMKLRFGDDTGIYPDKYLSELRGGEEKFWNTPRKYEKLVGTGRKLLLYERGRGITAEVEIERVGKDSPYPKFPWRNYFASKPYIFPNPIPLERIEKLGGTFKSFGRNRSAYQNITREQYRQLREA